MNAKIDRGMIAQLSLNPLKLAKLTELVRRFGGWWLKEFRNLFPERVMELLAGRGRTLVSIVADQDGTALELLDGAHTVIASERAASPDQVLAEIDRFLHSQGLDREHADIGLRLPPQSVFCRRLVLPAEAIGSIDAILLQDLARKTPFKSQDIYSDHSVLQCDDNNKVTVFQWVTLRQHVRQALLPLEMDIENFAFITANSVVTGQPASFINLRPDRHGAGSWHRKIAPLLCCSVLVLAVLAGSLKYYNQQLALDSLNEQITTTSSKAQQVRALVDQFQGKKDALVRLRLQRSAVPGLIDLWEETTRLLPSHSWLTELRLAETAGRQEKQVNIFGFSSAAPSLVGVFDGSPLFFDAALTSPVTFDPTEGRERFALQAKVKSPEELKEAPR